MLRILERYGRRELLLEAVECEVSEFLFYSELDS